MDQTQNQVIFVTYDNLFAAVEEGYETVGIEVTDAYYKLGSDRVKFALEAKENEEEKEE